MQWLWYNARMVIKTIDAKDVAWKKRDRKRYRYNKGRVDRGEDW